MMRGRERGDSRGEFGEIESDGIFMSTVWIDDGMGRRWSQVGLETAFYRLLVFIRSVTCSICMWSPVFGLPIVYLHAFAF
jgi:hypothetical protein